MAQAVILRPVTTDVPVRSLVSPCEICGRQGGTVAGLSASTSVSSVSMVPPVLRNHHLHTVLSKGQAGRSLGGFEESSALRYVGEHWTGKSRGLALVPNIASLYSLLFAYQAATQLPVNPANYCSISRTVPFHTVNP